MRCARASPRGSSRASSSPASASTSTRWPSSSASPARPVREALKQLAAMQLVDLRPHRGAVVAGLTPGRVAELFEAMGEVEAACTRLAALKMSSLERERLESLAGVCDRAMVSGSLVDIDETNRAFHASIHDGSHNAYLSETAHALRLRLAPFSRAPVRRERQAQLFQARACRRAGRRPGGRRRCGRGGDAPPPRQRRPCLPELAWPRSISPPRGPEPRRAARRASPRTA